MPLHARMNWPLMSGIGEIEESCQLGHQKGGVLCMHNSITFEKMVFELPDHGQWGIQVLRLMKL